MTFAGIIAVYRKENRIAAKKEVATGGVFRMAHKGQTKIWVDENPTSTLNGLLGGHYKNII